MPTMPAEYQRAYRRAYRAAGRDPAAQAKRLRREAREEAAERARQERLALRHLCKSGRHVIVGPRCAPCWTEYMRARQRTPEVRRYKREWQRAHANRFNDDRARALDRFGRVTPTWGVASLSPEKLDRVAVGDRECPRCGCPSAFGSCPICAREFES